MTIKILAASLMAVTFTFAARNAAAETIIPEVTTTTNTSLGSYTNLHSFTGTDGIYPVFNLAKAGTTLYGMTYKGGSNGVGAIFALKTDGKGFTNLYSFKGNDDGAYPYGGLVHSGTTLYGMTYEGGSNNEGTIFSIKTDGSGYKILYTFGSGTDGKDPYGSLILSGGKLYGTTYGGGADAFGTVFSISTNGTGYTNLHSFFGTDGEDPYDGLALAGKTLYGTTEAGGAGGYGTVFSVSTQGTNFQVLHNFTGKEEDGATPYSKVFVAGNMVYGSTYSGGPGGFGTIFKVSTKGENFQTLYSCTNQSNGIYPVNGVVVSGSKIYGMTYEGGNGGYGTLFELGTKGTGFKVLHYFTEATNDSTYPYQDNLILSHGTLYGGTESGDGYGTVFSFKLK